MRGGAIWAPALVAMLLAAVGAIGAAAGQNAVQTSTRPVEGGGSFTDVSAAGLAAMLMTKNFTLINVHVPYEGEIEGTDLFIPFDQVEARAAELPADKSARLVVYCRSGRMSAIAARTLVALGYRDVWHLDRGMIAWQRVGYPLVRKGG